eukprot:IDg2734t1
MPLSSTRLRSILLLAEERLESAFISVDEGASMRDGARLARVPLSTF